MEKNNQFCSVTCSLGVALSLMYIEVRFCHHMLTIAYCADKKCEQDSMQRYMARAGMRQRCLAARGVPTLPDNQLSEAGDERGGARDTFLVAIDRPSQTHQSGKENTSA